MTHITRSVAATAVGLAASLLVAQGARAQTNVARTPFLPVETEAPARLIVDPPIPERLAKGAVLIPYRTENIRILPVFGPGAADASPRIGHLHVTVDDLPWHWADAAAGQTVVVVGLPPGPHKVLIELADTNHKVLAGEAVNFTIPAGAGHAH